MDKKLDKRRDETEDEAPKTLEEFGQLLREKIPNGNRITRFNDWELMQNLRFANALYNRSLPGEPRSDRRYIGWLYRIAKRFIVRVLGWYGNPAVESQIDFNAYATRTFNEMKSYLDHLQVNEDLLSTSIKRDLALFRANIMFLDKYLEQRMLEYYKQVSLIPASQSKQDATEPYAEGVLEGRNRDYTDSLDVLTLIQLAQGSPREQKERQRVYLRYFEGCTDVVVMGCGRGELLQLLAAEGISAKGVEAIAALVEYCQEQSLDVTWGDPFEYLESREDASIDALLVTGLITHHSPVRLVRLLHLCREKLRDDGLLIIEAPSTFPLHEVTNYAPDGSEWAHPLSPDVLKLMCLASGFPEPEILSLDPVAPEKYLVELDIRTAETALDSRQLEFFQAANANFRKINSLLSGYSDYALAMRRGARNPV